MALGAMVRAVSGNRRLCRETLTQCIRSMGGACRDRQGFRQAGER
ncbi:hypothetical protein BSIN_4219 [Burkholderia singularis]|uniref:Uncharacterized protein n=1 Tax=Burkholderia singularis TaxID=1503053 RepID=A0A238H7W5_9BURK|nr:hypothetical protein BSIN_4219 [Burkholderia singularis]